MQHFAGAADGKMYSQDDNACRVEAFVGCVVSSSAAAFLFFSYGCLVNSISLKKLNF